jgi:hypothetical protein
MGVGVRILHVSVKNNIKMFFEKKFNESSWKCPSLGCIFFPQLSETDRNVLVELFSRRK